jgi:hypothetical protein
MIDRAHDGHLDTELDSFDAAQRADREFWRSVSPDDRVAAVEDLRKQWAMLRGPMTKDFEELFACLRHRKVGALVVGGYAVAFHGQPRFTKDIDVFVEPSPENAERVLAALTDFGFGGLGLTASDFASAGEIVSTGRGAESRRPAHDDRRCLREALVERHEAHEADREKAKRWDEQIYRVPSEEFPFQRLIQSGNVIEL